MIAALETLIVLTAIEAAALVGLIVYLAVYVFGPRLFRSEPAERTREERLAPFRLPDRVVGTEVFPQAPIVAAPADYVPSVPAAFGGTDDEPLRGTAESHIFKSGDLYRDYVARAEKNGLRPVKYQNWLVVMSVGRDDGEMGRLMEAERQARVADQDGEST